MWDAKLLDAHALAVAPVGVGQLQQPIIREVGRRGEVHQATLTRGFHIRNRGQRFRAPPSPFNHLHSAWAFREKDRAIRSKKVRPSSMAACMTHMAGA